MGMNSGNNPNLVKTAIDELFWGSYNYPETPGYASAASPLLFRQRTADNSAVITEEIMGPGIFSEHQEEEELELATIRSNNKQTWSLSNYKKTIPIPKEYFDDESFDSVSRTIKRCGVRARTTQDTNAMDIYAGGFTVHKSSDGSYLFAADHTNLNGDTIDNLETAALAPASLATMIHGLESQKAQDGELAGHRPTVLAVPNDLFDEAVEYTKSELKPNVTDNNLNWISLIYPGLQVLQSPLLGSSYHSYTNANTAHYLCSQDHGITRYVREEVYTRMINWEYDNQDRWMFKAGFREVLAPITWEGVIASTGAA